ncbi:MAG TPA: tRNA (adenosine(37)-N6)-threonylcarbamoyltransferase complex ATPase subunit type 1 TsaE [Salinimicrobium sp.]|nr:tRNA (adenosine(37)-N6)-threonylcarbamoyltransferase complex ATPase subunit type 1 TsaE [Salinimicrobium sp.]
MEIEYKISEIKEVARRVIQNAKTKRILFYGEMGAGKTTLIKEICKELGVKTAISSPTFSLVNEYEIPGSVIYHFDFYRIENETEALDIGIEDYFDKDAWIFIEWPQKIKSFLPENAVIIKIESLENDSRMLKFC